MSGSEDCEVLLVGAGPVGLLTTLFLAQSGVNAILIDRLPDIDNSPRAMGYGAPGIVELERAGVAADARRVNMEPIDYDAWIKWITIDNRLIAEFQPEDKLPGSYDMVLCGQFTLARIIQEHLGRYSCAKLTYPYPKILFEHTLRDFKEEGDSLRAIFDTPTGEKAITTKYLVGSDGARSTVRKLLNISYEGFTLPQWLVACNVRYPFREHGFGPGQFIVHPEHFCLVAKIDPTGLFRVSYNEREDLTRDEVLANVHSKFEAIFPGPKPLKKDSYKIEMVSPYRIHQRSATTYRKGRALLAGDAAHACSPFGGEYCARNLLLLGNADKYYPLGMGLTGGICDAGGLADCLIGVLRKGCDDSLLDRYAEIRRQKYTEITNPVSYGNLCAMRDVDPEKAKEVEPYKTLNISREARREIMKRAYLLGHDFRQDWPSFQGRKDEKKQAASGILMESMS
ncbi:uncharacterized protein A1O9_09379 [Exophiala aquamarina CBS 119918]|uniref:FAD-binding domain-containing protein n=1 Tax=Exophiala aquamarina CBS 119918 TaxID=1182545 RepID=A0A072P4Z7_9EURO|nr:uncharacterized protein A1O9_09379 [Exophiala aquamarina CBS 119918]KEF54936.1 hypothetical protein A1O9_09379 [Exophiala aquamarina CBS 119918]